MLKKQKILALIPARGLSKSIKKKNLLNIKNKSLIQRMFLSLSGSKYIDKIVCSSEDKKIISHCKNINLDYVKRPLHLSQDNSDVFFTAKHCLEFFQKMGLNFDILILAQATSPFVETKVVNNVIKTIINDNKFKSCQTVHKTPHNYHYLNTRVMSKNGELNFKFLRERQNKTNKQKKPATYTFGNLIACRVENFLKKKDFFCKPSKGIIIDKFSSFDLDDKEDLKIARRYKL